jgi:chemotaxis protein methyltransferase CheR
MRSAGFTDPAFARLAELAHLLAGLVFPPNRQPSAEAGMRRAMATLRISDPGALLRATETPGEARDVVLAELTVGESYFFRDAAQLDLLRSEILPDRLQSGDADRPLRVWSAGCASGEEPYTIAIMLRELGWPHEAQVIGTDVALPRIAAARRARYTRWALRGVSDARIDANFKRNGNYFDLDRSIRESVELRALNLVHDDYSSVRANAAFDLVLCRNVMIYFDLPTVASIATRLLDTLTPDGWLVLGASDPPLAHLVPCEAVMTSAGMAYRRPGRIGATPKRIVPFVAEAPCAVEPDLPPAPEIVRVRVLELRREEPAPPPVVRHVATAYEDILEAYEQADYPAVESMAIQALARTPGSEAVTSSDEQSLWILYIRAVANQGRLHEAGELCARALETHPLAAELHYLHATLLTEAGWHGDAAFAARRSIYLDRKFVMGHLLLGDALMRTGHKSGARIAFENVVALLADVDPAAPVAAADGVPASRVRQIATLRLRDVTTGVSA